MSKLTTTEKRRITLWIILILGGLFILAREYKIGATDPELRLFLAEAPPECNQFGQTNDPTPIPLWKGDCVAAAADTETPEPTATDTPTAVLLPTDTATPVPSATNTSVPPSNTPRTRTPTAAITSTPTRTATGSVTSTATLTPTVTPVSPTDTPFPTETVGPTSTPLPTTVPGATFTPWPAAPLCPNSGADHDTSLFHTLWNSAAGCHYDHEHGDYPFTQAVTNTFPGFNLRALVGNVGVGHSNPSSPLENTDKHQGFKWDVTLSHDKGCAGREGVATGVDALVSQYHAFGVYSIEFEARIHSALALMRQCRTANPTDYGYVFVIQHQDYGQRTAAYQGEVIPYPDTPLPQYDAAREPYMSTDCFGGQPGTKCERNVSRLFMINSNQNTNSNWISEPVNISGSGSKLFGLQFRIRDIFQVLDASDLSPAAWDTLPERTSHYLFMCSSDGGPTYDATMPGCRWNNSTHRISQVMGEIPAAWDNATNFDTDPRVGRITAQAFVSAFGTLQGFCMPNDQACFPIKMVNAFTGRYGSQFNMPGGEAAFDEINLPENDIYFCGNAVCAEGAPGAKSSGWIGPSN